MRIYLLIEHSSSAKGLGHLRHVGALISGEVAEFVGTLQQHQDDVLHGDAGLLRVGFRAGACDR